MACDNDGKTTAMSRLMPRRAVMRPWLRCSVCLCLLLILAACDALTPTVPTATPTRALSGPTQVPTPTVDARPPTRDPASIIGGQGQNTGDTGDIPADSAVPPAAVTRAPDAPLTGGQPVQITLPGAAPLRGDLYTPAERDPTVGTLPPGVLMAGGTLDAWGDAPARLRAAGFTVLVVALPTDATSLTIAGALDALSATTGSVDPGRLAVIGAAGSADLALIACAVAPLCDTLVMLSPVNAPTLLNVVPDFNPRPLLLIAATGDEASFETAQLLLDAAGPESRLQQVDGTARGAALLTQRPDLFDVLTGWLTQHLGG